MKGLGTCSPCSLLSFSSSRHTERSVAMSHLEAGPDHKEMKSTSSSSSPPPPHSGEAHITPSHPSSTSSSQSQTGDDTNTMKTKRILEYNLKPMATATAAAAANDNVEAGGVGTNSSGCATAGSGEPNRIYHTMYHTSTIVVPYGTK